MKNKTLILTVVLIVALVAIVIKLINNYNFNADLWSEAGVKFETFSQYRQISFSPILEEQQYVNGSGKKQYVIRSQVEWENFRTSLEPRRDWNWSEIDFETEMLVIVYAGWFPSGGFKVDVVYVTDLIEQDGKFYIYTQLTSPGDSCTTTFVETHPVHLIKLKTTDADVVFIELEEKVISC